MVEDEIKGKDKFFEKYEDSIKEEIQKYVRKDRIQLNHIKDIIMKYDKNVTKNELSDEEIFDNKIFLFIEEYLMENNITMGGTDLSLNDEIEDFIYDRTKKNGVTYTDIRKRPCNTAENFELAEKIKNGDKSARKRMIEGNIGLVYSYIIPRIKYLWGRVGNDEIEDLVQEGCIGLMKAIEQYDYTREIPFSTYAYHKIKSSIDIAVKSNPRGLKIPVKTSEQIDKINKVIFEFEKATGREPSIEEIAEQLDLNTRRVYELMILRTRKKTESLEELRGQKQDLEDYDYNISFEDETSNFKEASSRHKKNLHRQITSKETNKKLDAVNDVERLENYGLDSSILDGVYVDEPEIEIEDKLAMGDTSSYNPFDVALGKELSENLKKSMGHLTARETKTINRRFGFNTGKSETLEEVAEKFQISRERVRQIEAKALRKLRHPSSSKRLKEYLDEDSLKVDISENVKKTIMYDKKERNEKLEENVATLTDDQLSLFIEYFSRNAEKKERISFNELLVEKHLMDWRIANIFENYFDYYADEKKILEAMRKEEDLREKQNRENNTKEDTEINEQEQENEYDNLESEIDTYFEDIQDKQEEIEQENNDKNNDEEIKEQITDEEMLKNLSILESLSDEELEEFIKRQKQQARKNEEEIKNKKNEISILGERNNLLATALHITSVVNSQNEELLKLNNQLNILKSEQK